MGQIFRNLSGTTSTKFTLDGGEGGIELSNNVVKIVDKEGNLLSLVSKDITLTDNASVGKVLTSDASGKGLWLEPVVAEPYDIYNVPASRTSNVFASYRNLTTPILAANAGYLIQWDIAYSIPNPGAAGSGEIEIAVFVDDINIWNILRGVGRNSTQTKLRTFGIYQLITTTASTHTIDIRWRSVDNTTSMTIHERRLSYRRTF